MRTAEELESMDRHPLTQADGHTESGHTESGDAGSEGSAYKRFFEALEEYEDNCSLYGPGSIEAKVARVRVEQYRALAADQWRARQAA